jgi:hypothetical protein
MIDEACENIDKLLIHLARQVELMGELKRSLRLCQLMGATPATMPKVSLYYRESDSYVTPWKNGAALVIRDSNGETISEHALQDVHHDLWPPELLNRFRQMERRKARTLEKLAPTRVK